MVVLGPDPLWGRVKGYTCKIIGETIFGGPPCFLLTWTSSCLLYSLLWKGSLQLTVQYLHETCQVGIQSSAAKVLEFRHVTHSTIKSIQVRVVLSHNLSPSRRSSAQLFLACGWDHQQLSEMSLGKCCKSSYHVLFLDVRRASISKSCLILSRGPHLTCPIILPSQFCSTDIQNDE